MEKAGAGLAISAGCSEAFAKAILNLVKNSQQISQLAEKSLRAAPNHSREKQSKAMIAVIEKVAE